MLDDLGGRSNLRIAAEALVELVGGGLEEGLDAEASADIDFLSSVNIYHSLTP